MIKSLLVTFKSFLYTILTKKNDKATPVAMQSISNAIVTVIVNVFKALTESLLLIQSINLSILGLKDAIKYNAKNK